MRDVQRAAHEMEKAANTSAGDLPTPTSRTMHVFADSTTFKFDNPLWEDSKGMFAILDQAARVII